MSVRYPASRSPWPCEMNFPSDTGDAPASGRHESLTQTQAGSSTTELAWKSVEIRFFVDP